MELQDYLAIVRKYWIMIPALALATIGAVTAYTLVQTPQYTSSAELYVSVRNDGGVGTGELVQGTNFARQVVTSYVDVVTSDLVLAPVVQELGLNESPRSLAKRVTASSPANTVLVKIDATDENAERAAAIADAVASSFITVVEEELEKPESGAPRHVKLQTIQPAIAPDAPVSPNKPRNLALGVLLGLGAAVLRKVLDTRIHSPNDLAEVTEAPLLGALLDDPAAKDRPLTVQDKPQSPKAEAYRALRMNLQFLDVEEGPRTYIVSSSTPGEGKTSTSINIALAFAETGSNVALLDGDMRRPRIAEYLGIEGAVGLSDVLIGRAQLEDVAQRWGAAPCTCFPAESSHRTPANYLAAGRWRST